MRKNTLLKVSAGVLAVVAVLFYLDSAYSISGQIPDGVKVIKEFRETGWGNGDYTYAFKATATRDQYLEFCAKIEVPAADEKDRDQIGYSCGSGDVRESQHSWWNEPETPELKSYRKEKRGFTRVSFSRGTMYYLAVGW